MRLCPSSLCQQVSGSIAIDVLLPSNICTQGSSWRAEGYLFEFSR
jgi:hypothetical protein